MLKKLVIVLFGLTIVLAACGDDGDDTESGDDVADDDAADDDAADDDAADDDAADDDAADDDTAGDDAADDDAADDTAGDDAAGDDAADDTAGDDAAGDDAGAAGGAAVAVGLTEWVVDAPTTYEAGTVEFTVTNNGAFTHDFKIVAGTYAALPQEASGEVIEDGLDLLAVLDPLDPGTSGTVSADLAPGDYVLFCNIAIGPNSHAGAGQTLDITVS